MILRRITEHVRAQNWTAVALDFVIVVVGVFIGIQVANWNEAQANGRLGRDYKERLITEIQNDLAATQVLSGYYEDVLDSVTQTNRLLSAPEADANALVIAAYRASEYTSIPSNRATWDQIVSSGHLGLLLESAIESGLPDYYKFQESNEAVIDRLQDSPYRIAVRSLIPLPVQLSIREGCSDSLDELSISQGFMTECHLEVEPSLLEEAAEALRTSPAIRDTLRYQYSMVGLVQINNAGNIALQERVLAGLTAEELDQ